MQDSKGSDPAEEVEKKLAEGKAEATSDETLSDLEENKTNSSLTDTGPDPGPSPDGALDQSNEIKEAGPM